MKTTWTKDPELVEKFLASKDVRDKLIEVIEKKLESNERDSSSIDAYESPSWALRQADGVGYKRAMKEIISLLSG